MAAASAMAVGGAMADWATALARSGAPRAAQNFVRSTFECIEAGKLHVTAAAFTFGREDLIPDMFRGFIRDQDERLSGRLSIFRWYLDRHIEVDGDEHGPMALRMIMMSDIIHLSVGPDQLLAAVCVFTMITALSALFPAWRASRLQPVTAIQTVT